MFQGIAPSAFRDLLANTATAFHSVNTAELTPLTYWFGPFVLQPERQLLMRGEMPIRIGGRALDILTALVERPGRLIDKQELRTRVWPNVFVEEANLKAHVALLRRALGDCQAQPRFIATMIGRGYRFVSPVRAAGGWA